MKIFILSFFRIFYIPSVFLFYLGICYPFKKSYKKRLIKVLEKCGPVFIKCGQSISLKPYLFSEETIEACSNLQDKVSPAKINLKEELGQFYEDFEFINKIPIASGSIACVFEAIIKKTNEKVAIKILRKKAEKLIKADILLLKNTSFFLEFIPILKRLKLRSIVGKIEETLLKEINFINEQENLFKIKFNSMKIYPKAKTPKVYTKYTSKSILVTEFITGMPLSDSKTIKATLNVNQICINLIQIYLEQVYEDGFFHADFHPGNLFIDKYCNITMVDFGIVSSISYEERLCLAKILNGFLMKDYEKVFKAHVEGGYIKNDTNKEEFKIDLQKIGEAFIHSSHVTQFSISGILMELFKIMEKYEIEIKENLLLLHKTIFFVEAVVMKLNPNFNIWGVIKPWMEKWKGRNLGIIGKILSFAKILLKI